MILVLILVVESKDYKPSEGEKSVSVRLNEFVDSNCPDCGKSPVLIYERILIEGSLENYHLVHTEVEDLYECKACKHTWRKFQYL